MGLKLEFTLWILCVQVEKHWSANEVPEMTLEKLQMVATCNTSPFHKTKVLKWWNSSIGSCDARWLPPKHISKTLLGPFLNRCVWYTRVSVSFEIDTIVKIQMFVINEIMYANNFL